MRNHAVVLTYPGHFLQTYLSLQSLHKTHPECQRITILVDDWSDLVWPEYQQHCTSFYGDLVTDFVFAKSYLCYARLRDQPWIRQQVFKLTLDTILPRVSQVFWLDGDIVLYQHLPFGSTPFSVTSWSAVSQGHRQYVYDATGLTVPNYDTELVSGSSGTLVCLSNPPIRDIDLDHVRGVRNLIEQRHGDLINWHAKFFSIYDHAPSEWELLACYQDQCLTQPLNLVHWPTQDLQEPVHADSKCATSWVCDRQLDTQWWSQQAVDWSRWWQVLPDTK